MTIQLAKDENAKSCTELKLKKEKRAQIEYSWDINSRCDRSEG
jgi:hypothetical protein